MTCPRDKLEKQQDKTHIQAIKQSLLHFFTKFQFYCKQSTDYEAFKFCMSEDLIKLRGRLSSEAMTAADELPENDASSISFKPKEDPDAPPALQLEKDIEPLNESEDRNIFEQKSSFDLSPPRRSRTKSEDNQYTILGFLERKIRIRIMSQEFSEKVVFDLRQ